MVPPLVVVVAAAVVVVVSTAHSGVRLVLWDKLVNHICCVSTRTGARV